MAVLQPMLSLWFVKVQCYCKITGVFLTTRGKKGKAALVDLRKSNVTVAPIASMGLRVIATTNTYLSITTEHHILIMDRLPVSSPKNQQHCKYSPAAMGMPTGYGTEMPRRNGHRKISERSYPPQLLGIF